MEKPPAFVVPAGVVFQITDDGVHIENQGDIVLHTDFGRTLTRVVSHGGSVELHGSATAGTLSAHGGVTVTGALTAEQVEAGGDVQIGGAGAVRKLVAGGALSIGGAASGSHHEGASVQVGGDAHVDQVRGAGAVQIAGAFGGGTVRGGDVQLGGAVTARGIQGARSVRIGAGKVQIDAVIAPEVHLDARTSGRITVVESQNEVGPNAVKGGFRLADYEEMFGNPEQFLADRGLHTLDGSAPPPAAPAPTKKARSEPPPPPPPPEPAPVVAEPAPVAPPPDPVDDAPTVVTDAPAPTPTPVQMEIDEVEEEPSAPAGTTVPEHPLHPQLMDAVTKILDCYGGAEVPPAVLHLRTLIDTHEYDQVRAEITTIWSDLLKFHQKKGMRIQHQVTTTFNTINSLVKKM